MTREEQTARQKERISMAREICLYRGENPDAIDRRGIESWEKYEPLAGAVIREAERLFALRLSAQADVRAGQPLVPVLMPDPNSASGQRVEYHPTQADVGSIESLQSAVKALTEKNVELSRAQADVRAATIEECAKVADAKAEMFLSPRYTVNQPMGSFSERFACETVAEAIRALSDAKQPE